MKKQHLIFDTEIIGLKYPVFLLCTKCVETGETTALWHHKSRDLTKFTHMIEDPKYTWVSFNGAKFDAPLLGAWLNGHSAHTIKTIATQIIEQRMMPWEAYKMAGLTGLKFDHIDLIETAPGVMISLKTYAGRMHYPTMVDLPFHHDTDLTPAQCKVLESYCKNDLGVTEALFKRLSVELDLRVKLGATYGLDLRSKSDAQVAEAILRKEAQLGKATGVKPSYIVYEPPAFIKTRNPQLKQLIDDLIETDFKIDAMGSPVMPDFLIEPIKLRGGIYKVGIGGLHSQHDTNFYSEADDEYEISDIDAGSYYPTMILNCGYVPMLGGKGVDFLKAYRTLYDQRMAAKRAHIKEIARALKTPLNGTYGKLGNIYSAFYAPDLMLAVCLTGQLNLLILIDDLARNKGIEVVSANTDGIMVRYKRELRDKVFQIVAANSKRTGFEYEETRYRKVAMKDVNNYLAVTLDGQVKAKGLYADEGLQKNPTAAICALAAAEYLKTGTKPEKFIAKQKRIEPFLSIRNIKGGGVQHQKFIEVDDWEKIEPRLWKSTSTKKQVKRVSRPAPFEVGIGGKPFGRVARWYMTTETLPPITYVSNGNKVPKTDSAKLCLTLPPTLPVDLNRNWYVQETYEILKDLGLPFTK